MYAMLAHTNDGVPCDKVRSAKIWNIEICSTINLGEEGLALMDE